MDHLEDLLVDYQQLNTLISYFRKEYGNLYNNLQKMNPIDQREANVISKIFMFCKSFFAVNPRAIWKTLNKTIPETTENEALMMLFTANERLKNDIFERVHKYSSLENEKKGIEEYILMQFGNTNTFKKIVKEVDRHYRFPLYEDESYRDRRRVALSYVRTSEDEIQEKKYVPDDKKKSTLKLGLKDAFHRRNNDLAAKEEFLRELEAKKEKEKEKKDLFSLLSNSANSPMKGNKLLPIDARFSETDYQKSAKTADSLAMQGKIGGINVFTVDDMRVKKENSSVIGFDDDHRNHLENESALSDLNDITPNISQDGELDLFLKETFDEKFLNDMLEQKLEPKKLRNMKDPTLMQAEIKSRNFMQKKKQPKLGPPTSANNLMNLAKKENTIIEEGANSQFSGTTSEIDVDKQPYPRKKLGSFFEKALKEIKDSTDHNYIAPKEERGQDIPDEQLLGNLLGVGEEDSDDDEDEEKDSDDGYGNAKSNQDSSQFTNKFITTIRKMKEKNIMPPGYSKALNCTATWAPYESIDSERKKDKWLLVKDKCRTIHMQNEILAGMEEEDPTYGLDIAIRPLEFFSRVSHRWRNCIVEFAKLDKQE